MILRFPFLFYFSFFLLFPLCHRAQETKGAAPFYFPPGEQGLQEILNFVLHADPAERQALSEYLQPDEAVCEAVFDATYATEIYRYQRRLQKLTRIVVQPLMKEQTSYLLWSATTEELQDYTGEARYFPGGYHEIAIFMNPGITFYRIKFVQPGRKLGSAYDVLVYANDKWNLIHRPWVVLFE